MLRELWDYLTTDAGPDARAFGVLAEVVALASRERRQRAAWAPHVAACRRFVVEAAARAPAGGTALVAGSGLLAEVPLAELSARFDTVILADLVHTRAVRVAARRLPNVRLAQADLGGALAPLRRALAAGDPLPAPRTDAFVGAGIGFAVSCNLLSQLPLLPLEAIERQAPRLDAAARGAFARAMLVAHLDWLRRVAPVAALFTDVESLWLKDGAVAARDESLWGLPLPPPDRSWHWDIAPHPEEDPVLDLRHLVHGWYESPGVAR